MSKNKEDWGVKRNVIPVLWKWHINKTVNGKIKEYSCYVLYCIILNILKRIDKFKWNISQNNYSVCWILIVEIKKHDYCA